MSDQGSSSTPTPTMEHCEQQSEPASLNESAIEDNEEADGGAIRLWISDDDEAAAEGSGGNEAESSIRRDSSTTGMEIVTAPPAESTTQSGQDEEKSMEGVESAPANEREVEGVEHVGESSSLAIPPPPTSIEPDQTSVSDEGIHRHQPHQSNQTDKVDKPVLAETQSSDVEGRPTTTSEPSAAPIAPAPNVEIRVTSSPTPTPPPEQPSLPSTPVATIAMPNQRSSVKRLNLKGTPTLIGANNKPLRLKRPDEEINLEDHIAVRYTFPTIGASHDSEEGASVSTPAADPADDIHLAVVKHIRGVENDPGGAVGERRLYYVHFAGEDRRLDVWVSRSAIVDVEKEGFTLAPNVPASSVKKFTRRERRFNEEWQNAPKSFEEHDATTAKLEKEHEERTKVKNVEEIYYGGYDITTWYFSPFPPGLIQGAKKLYFCEHCLLYTKDLQLFICHKKHYCKVRRPPGREIYRDGNVAVFEVVGRENKLFLDHKTLYYDVDLFLFYVLCEIGEDGAVQSSDSTLSPTGLLPVGHFSKELRSENNLACIMVLPPFVRNGYGKLLIQLSYHLSDLECRIGTPEKPLSDLGKACYRDYWLYVLLETLDWSWTEGLRKPDDHVTMAELSEMTGIHAADVLYAFNTLQLVKYWKGSSLARLENGDHVVRVSRQFVQDCRRNKLCHPPKLMLNKDLVHWRPSTH